MLKCFKTEMVCACVHWFLSCFSWHTQDMISKNLVIVSIERRILAGTHRFIRLWKVWSFQLSNLLHLLSGCVCLSFIITIITIPFTSIILFDIWFLLFWRRAPICSNAYGRWFAPCVHHSVRMTYRPSTALWMFGSLRISHKKFHV